MADAAAAVARLGDRQPFSLFRDVLEEPKRFGGQLLGDRRARRGDPRSRSAAGLAASPSSAVRSLAIEACWAFSSDSAAFRSRVRFSASSMRSRTRSSCDRIASSAVATLVLHGLVFLVRLQLEQLPFVFGQAGLDGGDLRLDLLPLLLADGEPLLDPGHCRRGLLEARGERALHAGNLRDASTPGFDLGVELLQPDQMLNIRIHVGTRESYQTAGDWGSGIGIGIGNRKREIGMLGPSCRAHSSMVRAAGS